MNDGPVAVGIVADRIAAVKAGLGAIHDLLAVDRLACASPGVAGTGRARRQDLVGFDRPRGPVLRLAGKGDLDRLLIAIAVPSAGIGETGIGPGFRIVREIHRFFLCRCAACCTKDGGNSEHRYEPLVHVPLRFVS